MLPQARQNSQATSFDILKLRYLEDKSGQAHFLNPGCVVDVTEDHNGYAVLHLNNGSVIETKEDIISVLASFVCIGVFTFSHVPADWLECIHATAEQCQVERRSRVTSKLQA